MTMLKIMEFPVEELRHVLGNEGHVVLALDDGLNVWLLSGARCYDTREAALAGAAGDAARGWFLSEPPVALLVFDITTGTATRA